MVYVLYILVGIGAAAESLNEWADEEAGQEAVQRVLDSLDDIHALQDAHVDQDVLIEMLRDVRLHALLQVLVTNVHLKLDIKSYFLLIAVR